MRYTVKLNWCLPDFSHQQLWQNPDDPSYSNQDNFSLLLIFPLPNKNHHDTSTNILLVLCWDIPWTNGYVLACGPFGSKLSRFTPTFFSTKHEHKKPWDPAKWCLLTVCLFFVSDPFLKGAPIPHKTPAFIQARRPQLCIDGQLLRNDICRDLLHPDLWKVFPHPPWGFRREIQGRKNHDDPKMPAIV